MDDLLKPTTEAERAQLSIACKMGLNDLGQMILRRVMVERDRLQAENARLREAGFRSQAEICQTLGRALGYPTEGPEVGGDHTTVCTGDHVAETLAEEAAREIARLREEEK